MSKTTRIGSAVMAVILLLSTLLPLTVSAADVTMDLSNCEVSWDYTLTDEEGNTFSAAYGIRDEDNPFGGAVAPLLRRMHDYTAKRKGLTGNNSTWTYGEDYVYCYCVEHGVPLPDSGSYAGRPTRRTAINMKCCPTSRKTCFPLRWLTDTQTARTWKPARTPTPVTARASLLSGKSRWVFAHRPQN